MKRRGCSVSAPRTRKCDNGWRAKIRGRKPGEDETVLIRNSIEEDEEDQEDEEDHEDLVDEDYENEDEEDEEENEDD